MSIDGSQRPPDPPPPPPPPPEKVEEPVGSKTWDTPADLDASADRQLQRNADHFDAEAQRYGGLGDHDAASASQEAGDRARSLIGDSAQPNSADTPSSPAEGHLDSVGAVSDSQTAAGSEVARSDEMSSRDASVDDRDRQDDRDQRDRRDRR